MFYNQAIIDLSVVFGRPVKINEDYFQSTIRISEG
jgi:hypothetical protein